MDVLCGSVRLGEGGGHSLQHQYCFLLQSMNVGTRTLAVCELCGLCCFTGDTSLIHTAV